MDEFEENAQAAGNVQVVVDRLGEVGDHFVCHVPNRRVERADFFHVPEPDDQVVDAGKGLVGLSDPLEREVVLFPVMRGDEEIAD